MPRIYVSIGSNIEPAENIRSAVSKLRLRYGRLTLSTVYESEPVGFEGENFYNLVTGFDTQETPADVAAYLRSLEVQHGRARERNPFSPRPLDLDVLLYGDKVIEQIGLTIPRADITEYAFVLRPLAEIAPHERHPVTGETFAELWERLASQALTHALWPAPVTLEPLEILEPTRSGRRLPRSPDR
jgi:2-amino-4-hydroxy-6-hydroxymethyldihydropteridine diphosphokinase